MLDLFLLEGVDQAAPLLTRRRREVVGFEEDLQLLLHVDEVTLRLSNRAACFLTPVKELATPPKDGLCRRKRLQHLLLLLWRGVGELLAHDR